MPLLLLLGEWMVVRAGTNCHLQWLSTMKLSPRRTACCWKTRNPTAVPSSSNSRWVCIRASVRSIAMAMVVTRRARGRAVCVCVCVQGVFKALLSGAVSIESQLAGALSKVMGSAVMAGDNLVRASPLLVCGHPPLSNLILVGTVCGCVCVYVCVPHRASWEAPLRRIRRW